ncbi:MAG: hypothetical protein ACR2PZ_16090 [Pseudomonadales bacterium]
MKKHLRLLSTTAALASICVANGVFGQLEIPEPGPTDTLQYDAKMYPGSACQPYHGTQAHHFLSFQNGIAPRLLRDPNDAHPDAAWVTCPIVRDNIRNTDGTWSSSSGETSGSGVYVWVDVPDDSDPDLLSCHLFSYDMVSGHLLDSHNNVNPTQLAPGRFLLTLDVNRSSNAGNYVMRCYLPWRSTLRAYAVTEYLPTDDNS